MYCDAVKKAGGIPFVLPVLEASDATEVLSSLDGLLLTGGGDVAAWCSGQEAGPDATGVDSARDVWELALVAAADAAVIPILGICRGAQLLNVAAGGSLIQHLPAVTSQVHCDPDRDGESVHTIALEPSSLLASLTSRQPYGVNSLHHQAVDQLGSGLRAVAWSPDGIIEAIECVDRPQLGVQWHPELLVSRHEQAQLFSWLVAASAAKPVLVSEPALVPVPAPVPIGLLDAVA